MDAKPFRRHLGMIAVTMAEARKRLADVIRRIPEDEGRLVIVERGKAIAVLAHPEEIRILDAIETRFVDLAIAKARAESKGKRTYTNEEVKEIGRRADARRRARRLARRRAATRRR